MNTSLFSNKNLLGLSNVWGWVLFWGIVLIVLGCIAISATTFTTILSIIFLGWVLLISGIIMLVDTFKSWWSRWGGFLLHLIISILYIAAGLVLIVNPLAGSVSVTFLLGIFYLAIGLFRIIYSLTYRLTQWGLNFLNGIVALVLGLLILASWPESSLFVIGLFIGIDLLLSGFTYIIVALSVRELTK